MINDLTFRMPQHTSSEVHSFLQHALFCHVCNRSLCIISVKAKMGEEKSFYDNDDDGL